MTRIKYTLDQLRAAAKKVRWFTGTREPHRVSEPQQLSTCRWPNEIWMGDKFSETHVLIVLACPSGAIHNLRIEKKDQHLYPYGTKVECIFCKGFKS